MTPLICVFEFEIHNSSKNFMKLENKKNKLFHKCKNLAVAVPLTFTTVITACLPARAVSFNFTYQPDSITQQQIEGVELAGHIWSSYLQDSGVEVNVHFEMTSGLLPGGKLGGATPYIKKTNYDKFKEGLAADSTTNINFLPNSGEGDDKYSIKLQNNKINRNYTELIMTTANNKALGNDTSGDASGLDLYIQLESSANWSYDYVNNNTPNSQYDFVSVVLHELGHGLGFVSGIDTQTSQLALPTALDMFRYSSESASQGAIDYAVGGTKYFSTDGGETQAGEFSTGVDTSLGGDGDQASHWKANNTQPKNDQGNEISVSETSGNEISVNETSGNETSGNETPSDETPSDETSGNETSGNETPSDETSGDETSGDETSENNFVSIFKYFLGFFSTIDTQSTNSGQTQTNGNSENDKSDYLGIMSSTIQQGETRQISALDLTAFDYIGWDVNYEAQLNLSTLQLNAKNKANNIWGNSNYIADRSSEVESMIEESGIYEISYNFGGSSSSRFSFWQEESGEYSEALLTGENVIKNEHSMSLEQKYQAATTPEPNIIAGLGIVGLLGWLRRRSCR